MNDQTSLLQVRNLRKYFPVVKGLLRKEVASVKAVDGIDFDLLPGEVLGMVGESGCGKSTAARSAIRLIEPTSGQVTFQGKNLLQMGRRELATTRRDIQMVFQDPYASLNPRKTILDSIGEPLRVHGLAAGRQAVRTRVGEILELVGLSADMMDRYPHQFSGGQQQRICIGRAIALRPKVVVFDEAVSALDVSVQAQVLNLMAELKKELGLSYLFISHDLSVVRYICDRVVVLYLGKVVESASVKELFHNPKHPYTQALLSAVPRNHPGEGNQRVILTGDIPSPIHPPSGCPFHPRCPRAAPSCSQQFPPRKSLQEPVRAGGREHWYDCIW